MTGWIVVALTATWVLVLWPRKRTDRRAMREHADQLDALRRAAQR